MTNSASVGSSGEKGFHLRRESSLCVHVAWQECRGQTGHSRVVQDLQRRHLACRWRGIRRSDVPAFAVGVGVFVEWVECAQPRSVSGVDEVDRRQIPRCMAEVKIPHVSVRHLEAHAFKRQRAVAAPLPTRRSGAERAPQHLAGRTFATDMGAFEKTCQRRGTDLPVDTVSF